jgi:hypothetical protein
MKYYLIEEYIPIDKDTANQSYKTKLIKANEMNIWSYLAVAWEEKRKFAIHRIGECLIDLT